MGSLDANTNKVYRKKYFMDADKVVFSDKTEAIAVDDKVSSLIGAEQVAVADKPVLITHGLDLPQKSIRVEVIKDGERIDQLKIACPCGRHTELKIKYKDD